MAGSPRIAASKINGTTCGTPTIDTIISKLFRKNYPVNIIAAGRVTIPIISKKMTNCIEKQNIPHNSFTRISSIRL